MKFGRSYRLQITDKEDKSGESLIITNPITINFTVSRRMGSTLNELRADIYNLDENTRNFLFQEQWVVRNKQVVFEGGYDTLSTLFKGTLWAGSSYREGNDIVTTIECKSEMWELKNTTIYETINAGQTVGDVLRFIAGKYEGIEVGAIGDYSDKLLRPIVLNGNAYNLFREYSNRNVFIDNGKIYALKLNETIKGELLTIDASTGILASPQRLDVGTVQIQTLFEPRVVMGQMVELGAGVNKLYNGQYKVFGIQHIGTISGAVGGDLRTIIDLFAGGQVFKVVKNG
jgi:hypothetical protein